jgi:hypothetical protein
LKDKTIRFERRKDHQRNENLERLLQEINDLLGPVEGDILKEYRMPKYPVVLIVGCGRSGSTLFHQWLADTGEFAYPSNLLSRFYAAPYIGARIQQLLTDTRFDFNQEFFDITTEISFKSDLGKTRGALEPHEFWYFWRRFFPSAKTEYLDEQSLKKVDHETFTAELAAIEAVFDKPLSMKAHILRFNIPFLSRILDQVLFVFVKRHHFYSIQSLLESRVKFFGDRRGWYGAKPKEYDMLQTLDPIEQVAGQVYFTDRAIEEGLGQIDAARGMQVSYEDFCMAPERVFHLITKKFGQQGYEVAWNYTGPGRFQPANRVRLPKEDCARIIDAYKRFSGVELTL